MEKGGEKAFVASRENDTQTCEDEDAKNTESCRRTPTFARALRPPQQGRQSPDARRVASNTAPVASTPSNCWAMHSPNPRASPRPVPNPNTCRCARCWKPSGNTPNNSAANGWPRHWLCGCRTTPNQIRPATIDRLLAGCKVQIRGQIRGSFGSFGCFAMHPVMLRAQP